MPHDKIKKMQGPRHGRHGPHLPRRMHNDLNGFQKMLMRSKFTKQQFCVMLLKELSKIRQGEQGLVTSIQNIEARLIILERRSEKNTDNVNQDDGTEHLNSYDAKQDIARQLIPPTGFVQCLLYAHAARNRKCELCLWKEKEDAVNANLVIEVDSYCDEQDEEEDSVVANKTAKN